MVMKREKGRGRIKGKETRCNIKGRVLMSQVFIQISFEEGCTESTEAPVSFISGTVSAVENIRQRCSILV
jgi:hypothetical protein